MLTTVFLGAFTATADCASRKLFTVVGAMIDYERVLPVLTPHVSCTTSVVGSNRCKAELPLPPCAVASGRLQFYRQRGGLNSSIRAASSGGLADFARHYADLGRVAAKPNGG